jgi:ADP-ribose pyrophosphatase YjhB (NUDIX family)
MVLPSKMLRVATVRSMTRATGNRFAEKVRNMARGLARQNSKIAHAGLAEAGVSPQRILNCDVPDTLVTSVASGGCLKLQRLARFICVRWRRSFRLGKPRSRQNGILIRSWKTGQLTVNESSRMAGLPDLKTNSDGIPVYSIRSDRQETTFTTSRADDAAACGIVLLSAHRSGIQFMALPDVPPGPDYSVAIVIYSGKILLLREYGHMGTYYFLPGGWLRFGDTPRSACLRDAPIELRKAAREFGRQIDYDFKEAELDILHLEPFARHPWDRGRTYHYFLAQGNEKSILAGPAFVPQFDPQQHLAVWRTFEWVPLVQIAEINLQPYEAIEVCKSLADLTEPPAKSS